MKWVKGVKSILIIHSHGNPNVPLFCIALSNGFFRVSYCFEIFFVSSISSFILCVADGSV